MRIFIADIKTQGGQTVGSVAGKSQGQVSHAAEEIAKGLIPPGIVHPAQGEVEPGTLMVRGSITRGEHTETFGWMALGKAKENLPKEERSFLPETPGVTQTRGANALIWMEARAAGKF
jgi:hypothetical protein